MNWEKQIDEWFASGTITREQAQKMLNDINRKNKENRSNKFIIAVSTIGAALLGIGAILFIASNWKGLPDILKILILVGCTFGAYYLGYLFKYARQNYPKVGAALFFLGALLFGASLFLIAQIYNVNADNHILVLIWLIGILPLVYGFQSEPIAALSALLFYLWIGLFVLKYGETSSNMETSLIILYSLSAAALIALGDMHNLKPALQKISKIFNSAGRKILVASLFLLTFDLFSYAQPDYYGFSGASEKIILQLTAGILIFSIAAIIGLIASLYLNPAKSITNTYEKSIIIGLVIFNSIFFFLSPESVIFTVIYNIIFCLLMVFFIYSGYQNSDIKLVNSGFFWFSVFALAKYFDFFWKLMDRSLFFIIGGLALVLGGIALEKKRKQFKESFTQIN